LRQVLRNGRKRFDNENYLTTKRWGTKNKLEIQKRQIEEMGRRREQIGGNRKKPR
jgi:hypothetical protein